MSIAPNTYHTPVVAQAWVYQRISIYQLTTPACHAVAEWFDTLESRYESLGSRVFRIAPTPAPPPAQFAALSYLYYNVLPTTTMSTLACELARNAYRLTDTIHISPHIKYYTFYTNIFSNTAPAIYLMVLEDTTRKGAECMSQYLSLIHI